METCISRSNSHAFASCSSPCPAQLGFRTLTVNAHKRCMARQKVSAYQKQPTVMASDKKEGGNFNPFRNKKKEVSHLKYSVNFVYLACPQLIVCAML